MDDKTFELSISALRLKEILSMCASVEDDAIALTITKGSVSIRTVDPSHVAMIDLSIPVSTMTKLKKDESIRFALDVCKVRDFLRSAREKDMVHLTFDQATRSKTDDPDARIQQYTPIFSMRKMRYKSNFIDPGNLTDPKIPELTLPFDCLVYTSDFMNSLRFAGGISDHVAFIAKKDNKGASFSLQAKGDIEEFHSEVDIEELNVCIQKEGQPKITEGTARSLYPLDYLMAFFRCVKNKMVRIEMAQEYPCKIIAYLTKGDGRVEYLLAPRIENV